MAPILRFVAELKLAARAPIIGTSRAREHGIGRVRETRVEGVRCNTVVPLRQMQALVGSLGMLGNLERNCSGYLADASKLNPQR